MVMNLMISVNINAFVKPKRRNKKREIQILCMMILAGLTLFMLSGGVTSSSGDTTHTSTSEKSGSGAGYWAVGLKIAKLSSIS